MTLSSSQPARGAPARMVPAQGPRLRSRRTARVPRSTIALLAISVVLPLILFALAALQNRHDVERAAGRRIERAVGILREHAMKVFDTNQLMIDQINERLPAMNWSDARQVADIDRRLAHLQALFPQVEAITITDANGDVRASSLSGKMDLARYADQDWFRILKAKDQPLPVISHAAMGPESRQPVFDFAARVKGPVAGRFDGVISVSINKTEFMELYRDLERGYEHVVVLAREDGELLASQPAIQATTLPMPASSAASTEARSLDRVVMIDGSRWLFASERVGRYPVVIGFGLAWSSALRPWWHNIWGYGLVAALSSLALLCVSAVAIRRIALEGRATERWRRTAAQLRSEIAERAKVEDQLRQAQKMEAVGRLTGGIAHDFNNLLTVVIGSLDLLSRRMKEADPRQRALVGNAIDGATRAAALTARLLAFSRQHPLDPKPLDANALIGGMSNLLQRTLGETVSIECTFAAGLWPIFADPNQLENAILNLCVNAVDAMPKGGVLAVATANAELDEAFCARHADLAVGDYVKVSVSDTGTGMTPEVLAQAFEPFYTTKPVGKGTGLGLSQVYGFARQSGGRAAINSELGRGTTIDLYLPRLAQAARREPVALETSEAADMAPIASAGTTILLVEDEDLVRQFSSAALRDVGYTVLEAGTGPEGLDRLRQNPHIALLFTDVVLKGPMNGRELADLVRAERPDLPVLFTTGYTRDAIVHEGRLEEGVNFIAKPFTTAALTMKIASLLREPAVEMPRSAVG